MSTPTLFAAAMLQLRQATLALFDTLDDAELDVPALPSWTVADVFRHVADSDRRSVQGYHLLEFLPGKDLFGAFQAKNDRNLERLRKRGRNELRAELDTWGKRMAGIVKRVPARVARIAIPTAFGKLPIQWLAGLRLYDEWVHQWDVSRAVDRSDPKMADELAAILGPWQLQALEADTLKTIDAAGTVQVYFTNADVTAVYDLGAKGPLVGAATSTVTPDVSLTIDVATWCLLAAERVSVDQLLADDLVKIEGDVATARALLQIVRVV